MNVVITLTTKKQNVPTLPAASNTIVLKLMQAGVATPKLTANIQLPNLTATFSNVADGDYTVVAQRINMQGQPIGDSATSEMFNVTNTADIDVPETVNVTLS